jgi:hypothetical protein
MMRKVLRAVVPVCGAIFVVSLVIQNTVYRGKEVSEVLWGVLVLFGLFACGAIALVGLAVLVTTRPRRRG